MHREYYMLSMYAQSLYVIERLLLGKKPGNLDALAWLCCVLGIVILTIRRMEGNPMKSLVLNNAFGTTSDIPIYMAKIAMLFYIQKHRPFSLRQINIALGVVLVYVCIIDVHWVYGI